MLRIREKICGVEINKRFGRWTVLGKPWQWSKNSYSVVCQCSCGKVSVVSATALGQGKTKGCKSCQVSENNRRHGDTPRGVRPPRLHVIWNHMRARCNRLRCREYRWYGARGISITPEWNEYAKFKEWALANGYADNLTIDRINNDGNYEPGNCQWITQSENSRKVHEDRKRKH